MTNVTSNNTLEITFEVLEGRERERWMIDDTRVALNGQLSDAASVHLLDGELRQRDRGLTVRLSVYVDHIALKLFLIKVRCVHTNIGSALTSF